jgi:WASH complex subunit 7
MVQAASTSAGILSDSDSQKMRAYVRRLSCLRSFSKSISRACNTQFLYFHREFVYPHAVEAIYNQQKVAADTFSVYKIQYLVSALSDGTRLCSVVLHNDPDIMCNKFKAFLLNVLDTEIIKPLCRAIETDLRLHIHSKQLSHMKSVNPKEENLRPLRPFLDTAPIHVLGSVVSIKDNVAHYLDRTFYNLTTVALHDWRTYSDMKALANEKYGLVFIDNYLPMGSLDQGLDIL